jgi:hypothetical protein
MNRRAGILASAVALVGSAMPAAAQLTVEGRAYGTSVSVLGTGVELLTTADTGTQSATAPGSFDEAAEGSSVDATPVADVLSSGSTTSGTADDAAEDNDSQVSSEAGDQAVVLLPGQAPGGAAVLEVVTTGATVDIHCQDPRRRPRAA